jgi:hypothetical protein
VAVGVERNQPSRMEPAGTVFCCVPDHEAGTCAGQLKHQFDGSEKARDASVGFDFTTWMVGAALVLAAIVLLAVWGHFSVECPGCKKKGGVKLKDRKFIESNNNRTVYSDCYSCSYCGYKYYVNTEVVVGD